MIKKSLCLLALCTGGVADAQAVTTPAPSGYVLEKVVMLARHGVRPQTDSAQLEKATGQAWPAWTVPDGYLTGHGYMGIAQQGAWQLHQWQMKGLAVAENAHCPSDNQVWLWAAPDQRTKATGMALLDGMFPGCGQSVHSTHNEHDPLFDTLDMGLANPDMAVVRREVMAKMGSPEAAAARYQPAIALLRAAVCAPAPGSCAFLDKPWELKTGKHGKVKLTGPVGEGSNIGETIRLQYSENLPLSQVAFGHAASAQQVSALMALHAAKYDLISDTPEYARHGGSVLMRQLLNALTTGTANPTSASVNPGLTKPLVMFVGHDTNIAQIQTMFGFNWQLPQYPRNDIPPGGSLILERYRDVKSGERFVRLHFSARTLEQWRAIAPLTPESPLPDVDYQGPGCQTASVGTLCPLGAFVQAAQKQLVADGENAPVFE